MITALTVDEILQLLKTSPEQAVFDWKQDFLHPSTDDARGELIKDIAAIANASALSEGFIFYGVDPRRPDPVIGISAGYDDSRIQQLLQGKVSPLPNFLYYEVADGPKTIAVIQIAPSRKRPFIISVDIGRVRKGQIVIRRGSSTDGVTLNDLAEFFYGPDSAHFANVRQKLGLDVQRQQAQNENLAELRTIAENAQDQIWQSIGLPGRPGR
jgi:Putative DNA-binding domain